jgi:hypothetical protein
MDYSYDDGTHLSNVFYCRESLLKKNKTQREEGESSSAAITASSAFIDANNNKANYATSTAVKRSFTYCATTKKKSAGHVSIYHESSDACLDCNDKGTKLPKLVKYKRLVSQDVNFLVDGQGEQATTPSSHPAKKMKSDRKYHRICSIVSKYLPNGQSKLERSMCTTRCNPKKVPC